MGHKNRCCEVIRLVIPITITLENVTMPQTIQTYVTFTINPAAPPPLTETPASSAASPIVLPTMTVGVPVTAVQVTQISGGTAPATQPVVDPGSAAPLPPGLTAAIDSNGNLTVSGTPTVAGTGTVTLDVSDSSA
jgi:hypothetical protein